MQEKKDTPSESTSENNKKADPSPKSVAPANHSKWSHMVDGLNLIIIGFVLLLNTLDILDWGIWIRILSIFVQFWPFILIWIGIQFIFNWAGWLKIAGKFLGILVFIVIILVAAASEMSEKNRDWFDENIPFYEEITINGESKEKEINIDNTKYKNELTNRKVDIKLTAGKLDLASENSDRLLSLKSDYYENYGEPEITEDLKGSTINLQFEPKFKSNFFNFINKDIYHDLKIGSNELSTDIEAEITAGEATFDLTKNNLDDINIKMTAGELNTTFTENALPKKIELTVTAGNCNITLPKEVYLDTDYQVTAGNFEIGDKEFNFSQGSYRHNENGTKEIDFKVKVTAGNVKINFK